MKPEFIETETYAIITNIDQSILKLNPVIRVDGFEFVSISLTDLELNFSEVFNYPRRSVKPDLLISGDQPLFLNLISHDFREILNRYFFIHPGSEEENPDCEVYFLKKIDPVLTEKGDGYILIDESSLAENNICKFSNSIVKKLRLLKEGPVSLMGCFSIFKEERKVISKNISFLRPVLGRYQIEDSDITLFKKIYSENFFVPDLLKLAVDSFELSYEAPNSKMKFVLLMMGLESIFNKSSQDPISHILSRHIALLLGKTKPEFEELFQTVKKLYKTRCDIVHGSTERKTLLKLEKNIQNELNQLESLTRMVISELLWLNDSGNSGLNKESLFEYLNKKGFEG